MIKPLSVRWQHAWGPSQSIDVAVITVKRSPSYVLGTVTGLLGSSAKLKRVDLYVGSPDTSDVEPIQHWPQVKIHPMPETLWKRISPMGDFARAAANFMRALYNGSGGVLLVEDDIAIATGWRPALDIASAHNMFVSLYIAPNAANAITELEEREGRRHAYYVVSPPFAFHGSLGLFVPACERQALADYINERLIEGPFDELVQRFCHERGLGIIYPARSWVDHRGDVSAILRDEDHGPRRSPRWYAEPMPDTTNTDTTAEWEDASHEDAEGELAVEVAEPDALPEPPSRHDPACSTAKKHQPNCGCTGDARGPLA